MASYVVRKIDEKLWRQVKSRAAAEGLTLKILTTKLFQMYADGLKVKS